MKRSAALPEPTSREASIDSYPVLRQWLEGIHARCMWRVPHGGRPGHPSTFLEMWQANSHTFIVQVFADSMGWDVYTHADTNDVRRSLDEAEQRLGLMT